jgi:hypothetical protein
MILNQKYKLIKANKKIFKMMAIYNIQRNLKLKIIFYNNYAKKNIQIIYHKKFIKSIIILL